VKMRLITQHSLLKLKLINSPTLTGRSFSLVETARQYETVEQF